MGFEKSGYTTEAGGGQQEWHLGPEMQEEALSLCWEEGKGRRPELP